MSEFVLYKRAHSLVGYILMYDRLHLICREIKTRIDTVCRIAG